MAVLHLINPAAEAARVDNYCRSLRIVLNDLYDSPLDTELSAELVELLVHQHPEALLSMQRLQSQETP